MKFSLPPPRTDEEHCDALIRIFNAAVDAALKDHTLEAVAEDLRGFAVPPTWKRAIWDGITPATRTALQKARKRKPGTIHL